MDYRLNDWTVWVRRIALVIVAICTLQNLLGALPFNDDMVDSQIKTGQVMRQKPAGSIAAGMLKYRLASKAEAQALKNTVKPTAASIGRGKRLFGSNCTACHGLPVKENYKPAVAGTYMGAPNLADSTYAARSDGDIFAAIHFGNIIMPSVGWKISHDETWDIINYLRSVQK